MNAADTAWMLISTALVLLMTPALAFFYGGLVRSKNALNTMMMSFISLGFVGVLWAVVMYSLAFAPGNDWIGDTSRLFLRGVGLEGYGPAGNQIPHYLYMCYQGTFAIITVALISGAIVERMRFSAYLLFLCLWAVVIYSPIAHWVWGGGWLAKMGALDFAGGTVVHVNAGVGALVAALVVGRRKDFKSSALMPHNVPFVLLGAGVLWFGWFGFNAGSALGANALAASAFVTTHLGAAGALIGWLTAERIRHGKATTVGAATGAVAGLVAITPAAGFVEPLPALLIGMAAGVVCFFAVGLKGRLGYDDSLDVVGVHLVGGVTGALLTGVFATLAVNPAGADGSLTQVGRQAIAVGVTFAFSFVATLAILKVVDFVMHIRVTPEEEEEGLDVSEHGEVAYTLRERSPRRGRIPAEMTEGELQVLREELVLEAAARVMAEVRAGDLIEAEAKPVRRVYRQA
jgi:ammonium transporter, Amt family